jgi:hypothetical protein
MSVPSDRDIFGKADALLRKHGPGATDAEGEAFPVLTDVFEDGSPRPQASVEAAVEALEAPAQGALAQDVVAKAMAEIEGRLAAELERRLLQHLVPQVHAAVASALGDLHQELANAIGDAVAQALAQRNVK